MGRHKKIEREIYPVYLYSITETWTLYEIEIPKPTWGRVNIEFSSFL